MAIPERNGSDRFPPQRRGTRWLAAGLGLAAVMSIPAASALASDAPRQRDVKGEAEHKDHNSEIEIGVQHRREVGTERRPGVPTASTGRQATANGRREAVPIDSGKTQFPEPQRIAAALTAPATGAGRARGGRAVCTARAPPSVDDAVDGPAC